MARPSEVSGRTFELAAPYEGHPVGTRWTTHCVRFDVFTSQVVAMEVNVAGRVETWTRPGCLSVEVDAGLAVHDDA